MLFFGEFGFLLCLTGILCWTLFTTAWNGLDKTNHLQFGPVHLFFASSAKCMAINCYIVDIPLGWPQWWSFGEQWSAVYFSFSECFDLTFFEFLKKKKKVIKFDDFRSQFLMSKAIQLFRFFFSFKFYFVFDTSWCLQSLKHFVFWFWSNFWFWWLVWCHLHLQST